MATTEKKPTEIVTCIGRISFPSLFEKAPTSKGGKRFAWQAALLLPPDTDLAPFYACIKAAALDKFGPDVKLSAGKNPIKACSEKDLDGYEDGWHFINVKAYNYIPTVVDQNKQEILDPERIFAGCWVRMALDAYGYDREGSKGVSFGLNAVQLVREGERLDGRRASSDMFDTIEVEDMPDGEPATADTADDLFG